MIVKTFGITISWSLRCYTERFVCAFLNSIHSNYYCIVYPHPSWIHYEWSDSKESAGEWLQWYMNWPLILQENVDFSKQTWASNQTSPLRLEHRTRKLGLSSGSHDNNEKSAAAHEYGNPQLSREIQARSHGSVVTWYHDSQLLPIHTAGRSEVGAKFKLGAVDWLSADRWGV